MTDNACKDLPRDRSPLPVPDVAGAGGREIPAHPETSFGDRIQTTALDVLECLIEATYARDRKGQLARANLGIEKLRFFFRLAVELHYLDRRRYQHAARTLDEIGRLIGGWAKAHAAAGGKVADE
jgi:hypothetical protein